MEELEKESWDLTKETVMLFDGTFIAIVDTYDVESTVLEFEQYNPSIDVLAVGGGVTEFEVKILFEDYIILLNNKAIWLSIDVEDVELLVDLITEKIELQSIFGLKQYAHLHN